MSGPSEGVPLATFLADMYLLVIDKLVGEPVWLWDHIPTLFLTGCVSLSKLLSPSVPHFSEVN